MSPKALAFHTINRINRPKFLQKRNVQVNKLDVKEGRRPSYSIEQIIKLAQSGRLDLINERQTDKYWDVINKNLTKSFYEPYYPNYSIVYDNNTTSNLTVCSNGFMISNGNFTRI